MFEPCSRDEEGSVEFQDISNVLQSSQSEREVMIRTGGLWVLLTTPQAGGLVNDVLAG